VDLEASLAAMHALLRCNRCLECTHTCPGPPDRAPSTPVPLSPARHATPTPGAGGAGLDAALREAEDKSVVEDIEAAEEDYDSPEQVRERCSKLAIDRLRVLHGGLA
jgi:hypothetical protein